MAHVKICQILKFSIKKYVFLILRIVLCYAELFHVEEHYARGCVVLSESDYFTCYLSHYYLILSSILY
jgi:hypothetical protein